jgi:hypothetical protein
MVPLSSQASPKFPGCYIDGHIPVTRSMSTANPPPYGVLAEFGTAADIIRAAEMVRDAGYRQWDVFTPCPIHGMDEAMGLPHSPVGWFTFIGGALGFTTGMVGIWYMNGHNYPLAIGGKPLFSPIYAFPVSYELTILFGAFGAFLGMLILNRLPRLYHPVLKNKRFKQVTHDRFFILIECRDPHYSETGTRRLLESAGCTHLELLADD